MMRVLMCVRVFFFFFQAEDGIRDLTVTGVQTCALPIFEGEANDYVGKGLCGGDIVVRPFREASGATERHVLLGNTALYGATAGTLFAAGRAGDRFGVRNSGAVAVIEGAGDHCCEYMTAGTVVVLGPVGRNFAAGMSNGVAYVLDEAETFTRRCNHDMVTVGDLDDDDDRLVQRLRRGQPARPGHLRSRAILGGQAPCPPLFPREPRPPPAFPPPATEAKPAGGVPARLTGPLG